MSMTPGPWRHIPAHRGFVIEASDKCYDIAVVRDCGNEDNEANARAISAIPDLVEALRLAVRQNSHDMLMTGEEIRQCEAALTKAGVTK